MSQIDSPRAREMLARVVREWTESELSPEAVASLEVIATAVMRERALRFVDEHHPAFLHPLRSVTLLLEAGESSAAAHRAALLFDTETPPERPQEHPEPPEALARILEADAEELLEELLLAEPWVRTTWLAERLDHIRHLHLWAGEARTREAHSLAEGRELPLAHREGGRLARAWTDWMSKAERYRILARSELRPIRPEGLS